MELLLIVKDFRQMICAPCLRSVKFPSVVATHSTVSEAIISVTCQMHSE